MMHEFLEKIAHWKAQVGISAGSAVVAGGAANDVLENGITMYHWLALGISGIAALTALASLLWKMYTYFEGKKKKKKDKEGGY